MEARVQAIVKQYRDTEAPRQAQEDAKWETITGWDLFESDRARRDVARA